MTAIKFNFIPQHGLNTNAVAYSLVIGLLIKFILDFSYAFPLRALWGTDPVYALNINLVKVGLSYLLIAILLLFCPVAEDAASFFTYFVLIVVIVPMSTVYALKNESSIYFFLVCLCYLTVEVMIGYIGKPSFKLPRYNFGWLLMIFLWGILAVTTAWVVLLFGIPTIDAMNLRSVYVIRKSIDVHRFLRYLLSLCVNCIIPLLVTHYFIKKKYLVSATLFLILGYFYLCFANKTWLFLIFLMFLSLIVFKYDKGTYFFLLCLAAGLFLCIILEYVYFITNIDFFQWPFTLFVRRTFLLPGILKYNYFDFFQSQEPIGLWGSIFSSFMLGPVPYSDLPFANMVGEIYFHSSETYANTGMFATELINFGLYGIPISAFLFFVFLKFCQLAECGKGNYFIKCLFIYSVYNLSNSSVIQLVLGLTGWFSILMVLLYSISTDAFLPGENNGKIVN